MLSEQMWTDKQWCTMCEQCDQQSKPAQQCAVHNTVKVKRGEQLPPLVRTSHQKLLEPGQKIGPQAHHKVSICSALAFATTVSDMFLTVVILWCSLDINQDCVSFVLIWHSFVKCVSLAVCTVYTLQQAFWTLCIVKHKWNKLYKILFSVQHWQQKHGHMCAFSAAVKEEL